MGMMTNIIHGRRFKDNFMPDDGSLRSLNKQAQPSRNHLVS